eukprot:4951057-Amphidinium_carterae.1
MPRGASAEAFIPEPRRPSITPLMPGAPSRFLHASAQDSNMHEISPRTKQLSGALHHRFICVASRHFIIEAS